MDMKLDSAMIESNQLSGSTRVNLKAHSILGSAFLRFKSKSSHVLFPLITSDLHFSITFIRAQILSFFISLHAVVF